MLTDGALTGGGAEVPTGVLAGEALAGDVLTSGREADVAV